MNPHPRSPVAALFVAPGKFDFFQAVRLLERLAVADVMTHLVRVVEAGQADPAMLAWAARQDAEGRKKKL